MEVTEEDKKRVELLLKKFKSKNLAACSLFY